MLRRLIFCIGFITIALPLGWSQKAIARGSVAGQILCDGGHPARHAIVRLTEAGSRPDSLSGASFQSNTDLQGRFMIPAVPAGTYTLYAQLPGYIPSYSDSSRSTQYLGAGNGSSESSTVHVSGNEITNVNVVINKGAAISGKVSYNDGQPASGITVVALALQIGGSLSQNQATNLVSETNDQGKFRIAGLATGLYTLKITIPSSGRKFYKAVYLGGVDNMASARQIEVTAPDQVNDIEVELPASSNLLTR
ncbi:MAG TPA: hypothetical protein VMU92_07470 [Acidobacteriaceae bacterium]|nr:hypothetical protein [Acidobacteriaceae bacterium]